MNYTDLKISVIVPGRNCPQFIEPLATSLKNQTLPAFEMLFIDDASTDNTAELAEQHGFKVIRLMVNNGPGQARNKGVEVAQGDVVAFTDSDCAVTSTWLENIAKIIARAPDEAIMGRTNIPKAGFWADCISDLGFPGGANLGFEKVWHVDANGYTNHITSCNFALTKKLIWKQVDSIVVGAEMHGEQRILNFRGVGTHKASRFTISRKSGFGIFLAPL